MALETLVGSNQGTLVYTSKMTQGETVSGYYVGMTAGDYGPVIIFQNENGSQSKILSSGNLRYLQENLKEKGQTITAGAFTVITKTGSYKNKKGTMSSTFSVAQDKEKTIPVAAVEETSKTEAKTSVEERLANLKNKKTA